MTSRERDRCRNTPVTFANCSRAKRQTIFLSQFKICQVNLTKRKQKFVAQFAPSKHYSILFYCWIMATNSPKHVSFERAIVFPTVILVKCGRKPPQTNMLPNQLPSKRFISFVYLALDKSRLRSQNAPLSRMGLFKRSIPPSLIYDAI